MGRFKKFVTQIIVAGLYIVLVNYCDIVKK